MGATGYVLTIPDEVLKKLELADTKINAIAESSEKQQTDSIKHFRAWLYLLTH